MLGGTRESRSVPQKQRTESLYCHCVYWTNVPSCCYHTVQYCFVFKLELACFKWAPSRYCSQQGYSSSLVHSCEPGTSTSSTAALRERGFLFNIQGSIRSGAKRQRAHCKGSKRKQIAMWSIDFICLPRTGQTKTPSALEIAKLMDAGLDRKKLSFAECGDCTDVHEELLSSFPALSEAGGYELLRVSVAGRRDDLDIVPVPHQGYVHTANYLKEVARQAKIYIYISGLCSDSAATPLSCTTGL